MGVVEAADKMGPQGGNLVIRLAEICVENLPSTNRMMARSGDDSMAGL